jgi:hypothetical protein
MNVTCTCINRNIEQTYRSRWKKVSLERSRSRHRGYGHARQDMSSPMFDATFQAVILSASQTRSHRVFRYIGSKYVSPSTGRVGTKSNEKREFLNHRHCHLPPLCALRVARHASKLRLSELPLALVPNQNAISMSRGSTGKR